MDALFNASKILLLETTTPFYLMLNIFRHFKLLPNGEIEKRTHSDILLLNLFDWIEFSWRWGREK